MHKKLFSTLAIMATAMLGFTAAAATPGLEREACVVTDTVYDQLATMQIDYSDQIAAKHYEAAQAIYDSMQTILSTACGNTNGIVALQTAGQSAECVQQLNTLQAHYAYNMELGRVGIAAAIRQNIQTYLDGNTCSSLTENATGPDALALNALLTATISQTPDVIPYSKNLCFIDNVVDNFVEQINNIGEESVLQSVNTVVSNLLTNPPAGTVLEPIAQERQTNILTYAKGVIQNRWDQLYIYNPITYSQMLNQYLQGGSNMLNDLINSEGLDTLFQLVLNGPDLHAYYNALKTLYPSRNDFATALDTNPNIAYTRNPISEALDMSTSTNGLQFIIPAATGTTDTGSTGDYVFTYRYYDGITIPNPKDANKPDLQLPTHIIGDLVQGGDQKVAVDAQITYRDAVSYFPANVSVDVYAKPYIINFDATFTALEDGNTKVDIVVKFYGPATCDFELHFSYVVQGNNLFDGDDGTENPMLSMALTASVNNSIVTWNITDKTAWDDAISAYELASGIQDPTSAAAGNPYMDANISIGGIHIANVDAGDNMFKIKFDDAIADNPNAYDDLLQDYILNQQLDAQTIMMVIAKIQELTQPPAAKVTGCTDVKGTNYNADATEDDGSCVFPAPTPGPGPATAVSGCTDNTASNYDKKATVDDGSCTYSTGSGSTVPGCTDNTATNYNPAATEDNGSCTYGEPAPVPGPGPTMGCMDPAATNYDSGATVDDGMCSYPPATVPGCTDPAANNYNAAATENNGSCTYDEVW